MRKKKNKKKKVINFLLGLIILATLVYIIININIKNIYIKGNKILTDQEIIELAGIENYPKLFKTRTFKIKNKIKMNQVVEDVKVRKNIFGRIDIEIKEYNMLLKDEVDNSIYLSNAKKVKIDEYIAGLPTLINVVEDGNILKDFLKKLDKIDKKILAKISEIEYKPNDYDKELFLFYMNDGNYIYINTIKLSSINKYEEMLEQLEGKKGILYLDSGNHFEEIH